ncbi:MAG: CpXC domain-containing protein [Candidatus Hodarchaeota archaeon]
MAGTSTTVITCIKCKNVYEAEVVDHIDLSEDHELAKSLKTGRANRVQCPKCRKVEYLDRSIVVNFEPENLIVMYDPAARKKAVREGYMKDYTAVVSFNEALQETAEETEFKIVTKADALKKLVTKYLKDHK